MGSPSPKPPIPPHRWIGLLLSRRFWIVVGAIVVAALALYALVAVPVGPTAFGFSMANSACRCLHTYSVNHSFPDDAYVSLRFTSHYLTNSTLQGSEYVLIIRNPSGVEIVYTEMTGGSLGAYGTANTSATFNTNSGGAFEFTLLGAYPTDLPPITAWVNGTYHAPILS